MCCCFFFVLRFFLCFCGRNLVAASPLQTHYLVTWLRDTCEKQITNMRSHKFNLSKWFSFSQFFCCVVVFFCLHAHTTPPHMRTMGICVYVCWIIMKKYASKIAHIYESSEIRNHLQRSMCVRSLAQHVTTKFDSIVPCHVTPKRILSVRARARCFGLISIRIYQQHLKQLVYDFQHGYDHGETLH